MLATLGRKTLHAKAFMLSFGASVPTLEKETNCSALWDPLFVKVFYRLNGLTYPIVNITLPFLCVYKKLKFTAYISNGVLFHASLVFP